MIGQVEAQLGTCLPQFSGAQNGGDPALIAALQHFYRENLWQWMYSVTCEEAFRVI